jgi:hypothetical protein
MKKSTLLALLGLIVIFIGTTSPSLSVSGTKSPEPFPTEEPDLATITLDDGKTCGVNGAATAGTEKAKLNQLKNRFRLPSGNFETITFGDLLKLNQGRAVGSGRNRRIVGFPNSSDRNNQRAVTLEGFVDKVFVAGCAKRETGGGESCNCNTTSRTFCDTHIDVILDERTDKRGGRNIVVVEVTQRSRLLAAQGLLSSNIGNDWSTDTLKSKIEKHRVRFSGFLFFDTDHADQAFQSDPRNRIGGSNFRQTAWEIHPVMGIQLIR